MADKKMYSSNGYMYLKTGDMSGDLCKRCDTPMIIDKSVKEFEKYISLLEIKKVRKVKWTLRCQGCGREVDFVSNNSYGHYSAYK